MNDTTLRGDDEIISLLDHITASGERQVLTERTTEDGAGTEYLPVKEALGRIVRDQPDWALVRYGRVLKRLAARQAELVRYRANVTSEIDREAADIAARMATLNRIFDDEALRLREEQGIKSLEVPTIGTWQTRTVPGGWQLPAKDEAIIERLDEADRPLYVRTVEVEKVDRDALRQGLDATVSTYVAEIVDDAADSGFEVDGADERARHEVAERYGIEWRPARVSVRGPFGGAS